jgi:hypothetical protein
MRQNSGSRRVGSGSDLCERLVSFSPVVDEIVQLCDRVGCHAFAAFLDMVTHPDSVGRESMRPPQHQSSSPGARRGVVCRGGMLSRPAGPRKQMASRKAAKAWHPPLSQYWTVADAPGSQEFRKSGHWRVQLPQNQALKWRQVRIAEVGEKHRSWLVRQEQGWFGLPADRLRSDAARPEHRRLPWSNLDRIAKVWLVEIRDSDALRIADVDWCPVSAGKA